MGDGDDNAAWNDGWLRLEQLELPALVIDARGRVRDCTDGGRRLLGRLGVEVSTLPADLPAPLAALLERAPTGEPVVWATRDELAEASLSFSRHPLGVHHALVLLRDTVSGSRELGRRLHAQRLQLTGRLVASVVHDLRGPLASIIFSGDALTSHVHHYDGPELQEVVQDMVTSARRLRRLVDGLLGFARREAVEDTASRVDEVIDSVSALVRPVLRSGGHSLRTFVAPGARVVRGGRLFIEQILLNLVLNAVEAAAGPIEIAIGARVDPADPGRVRIRVTDTGPGIPEELRRHVFLPFYTTKDTGTGLGLSTARESAREQGGDLTLDASEAGRPGASFSLYLTVGRERGS